MLKITKTLIVGLVICFSSTPILAKTATEKFDRQGGAQAEKNFKYRRNSDKAGFDSCYKEGDGSIECNDKQGTADRICSDLGYSNAIEITWHTDQQPLRKTSIIADKPNGGFRIEDHTGASVVYTVICEDR